VRHLRPAAETCEQCHWPGKFYSSFEMRRTYYPSGASEHDSWMLRMLIHVGNKETTSEGIHAHMYVDNDIYYVAEDEKRQEITWVKSVGKDGRTTVYTAPDSKYKEEEPPSEIVRKMDCMDCHNRPTHHFEAPYELVNAALLRENVSPEIPGVKSKMMEVLSAEYASTAEAGDKIPKELRRYYQTEHPEFYAEHREEIDQFVDQTVIMYNNYFFPEMKARWDVYPDNIGHLWSPGCFRCHDGEHASTQGKVITKDCNACHTIIEQGPPKAAQSDTRGLSFTHPFEDDGLWQEMKCFDCHTGN
jgi:hypothetical protein